MSRPRSSTKASLQLLDNRYVADLLGVKPNTLAQWRRRGQGPVYVRAVGRIRYEIAAIDAFIAASRVTPSPRQSTT